MKIMVVIPTLGFGGAERLLTTLLPKIQNLGHSVIVCLFYLPTDLVSELNDKGVQVNIINLRHRWFIFEAVYKLIKEIKRFNPDVLWGHLYFGILYSRLVSLFFKKVKVISVLHYHVSSDSIKKGLWYSFRHWMFNKSKKIDFATIAVSKSVKKDYEEFYGWNNIETIYNSIDTTKIIDVMHNSNVIKTRNKYRVGSNQKLITLPGRLHESKGHKYLIEAIQILKEQHNFSSKVVLAGDGPFQANLKKLIDELGLQEQFILTGNLEQLKLFSVIYASDLIVIPSLFEAFGLVAIESMSLKKPIIVSNIDGLTEITKNNFDAIHVPAKDSNALAQAILKLFNNTDKVKYLISNAEITASKFNSDLIIKQWIDLFNRDKN